MKDAWFNQHLVGVKSSLPFSFTYDGQPSATLLAEWPVKVADERLDANRSRRTRTWTDPQTGLEVRCVAVDYTDYPAVEWTVWFKNTGTVDTPILENMQGLDVRFEREATDPEFVLNGIKGDFMGAESYEPYRLELSCGSTATFGPHGPIWAGSGTGYGLGKSLGMLGTGKSCDGPDGWPYFNLQTPGGGTIIAVGWPGQWAASFARDADTGVTVRAGQEVRLPAASRGASCAKLDSLVGARGLRIFAAHTRTIRERGDPGPPLTTPPEWDAFIPRGKPRRIQQRFR